MTKTEKYLKNRLESLSEEKVNLITKINKITIEIEEVDNKIDEMLSNMDSAFEIFSPKPKKNDFNKKEIDRLNNRKEELLVLRDEFVNQCNVVEEDILSIKDALGEDCEEDYNFEEEDIIQKKETLYGFGILEKQETEKQRIANEISDITINNINNLIHKCDICQKIIDVDSVRAKLELEIMSKNLKDLSQDIKKIIFELKPVNYDNADIEVSLERLVNLFKISTDMIINLNISGKKVELNPVVESTCVRIVKEALENSIKYSEGKNVNINFIYEDEFIKIEIEDDGKGIDFEKNIDDNGDINTFGLSVIKEKVYLLAGKTSICSDNNGTKINVLIPILNN